MNKRQPAKSKISRREFAVSAAMGATAICLPVDALALSPTAAASPQCTNSSSSSASSSTGEAEIEMKIDAIFRKYGSRFNEAQKADIRRLVSEGQKPLEAMRAFALQNGDQPGNTLRIYPDAAAAPAVHHNRKA
jgi:hypothetical protein